MINKRDYESLQIEGGIATPASPLNQKSGDEAPTPWWKTNKFLFVGLTVFLFFGITMTRGTSEEATLGHSDAGSAFCCYYSTDMNNACGTCKSKEDSGDWCSATLAKCVDCGGVFCPSTDTPSPPQPAADDDDTSVSADVDDDDNTDDDDDDDKASGATDDTPSPPPPAAADDDDTASPPDAATDDTPAAPAP